MKNINELVSNTKFSDVHFIDGYIAYAYKFGTRIYILPHIQFETIYLDACV